MIWLKCLRHSLGIPWWKGGIKWAEYILTWGHIGLAKRSAWGNTDIKGNFNNNMKQIKEVIKCNNFSWRIITNQIDHKSVHQLQMPAVDANKMPRTGRSTTAGCLPDQSLYTWNGKDRSLPSFTKQTFMEVFFTLRSMYHALYYTVEM